VVPGEPTVKEGIYSWIRHPNYFVVAIELALFPLLSWSWTTSFVFTILNGTLLWFRIRSEEQALLETSDYRDLQEVAKRFHFF
jgi:methyltransferase